YCYFLTTTASKKQRRYIRCTARYHTGYPCLERNEQLADGFHLHRDGFYWFLCLVRLFFPKHSAIGSSDEVCAIRFCMCGGYAQRTFAGLWINGQFRFHLRSSFNRSYRCTPSYHHPLLAFCVRRNRI